MFPEAYILVGGRSTRFEGGDKPFARFEGKTLAENAVEIVRAALPESNIFFVARHEGQLVEESRRLNIGQISDRIADRGPLGGLFSALVHCDSEWLILFACDMPLMSPDVIAKLWDLCEPRFGAAVPRQADGRLQPLCAFYRVSETLPVVENLLHRPDRAAAMMSVIDALEVKIVEPNEICADPDVWTNINTVEDLQAISEIERKLSGGNQI
jgi:molybdopterin-guanine dinucleotide biosynthesis protein A